MDIGALVTAARRVPVVAELRAGADRLAINLRLLLPVIESNGAQPELARELRAVSTATDYVSLIQPTGSSQARIDTGLRQFAIPAALRDAILVAVEQAGRSSATAKEPPVLNAPSVNAVSDPSATARLISASSHAAAAVALKAAGLAPDPASAAKSPPRATNSPMPTSSLATAVEQDAVAERAPSPAPPGEPPGLAPSAERRSGLSPAQVTLVRPLLDDEPDVGMAIARLRAAVDRSGLFFESHLAAWARGERDLDAVQHELLQLAARGVADAPHAGGAAGREADQVDVLTRDAVRIAGAAWLGQPVAIDVRRERGSIDDEGRRGVDSDDRHTVFSAQLRLDLPRLGAMAIRLRLVGQTVAVAIDSGRRDEVEPALSGLATQLEARGLRPAGLLVQALPGE